MVEIEQTGAGPYTSISVRRKSEGIVELRLVSGKNPKGDGFNKLTPSEARCVAYMLLAEAEHPTGGGSLVVAQENAAGQPLIVKRVASGSVKLRLWEGGGPHTDMSIPTTRRVAFALMGESEA